MLSETGGKRFVVVLLAGLAVVVAALALDGRVTGNDSAIEASQTDDTLDQTIEDADDAEASDDDNRAGASAADAAPALAVKTDEQLTSTTTVPAETTTVADESAESGEDPSPPATDAQTTEPPPTGDKPVIHLTFDDGPSELTPRVLDLVEQYNGRATFFVMGSAVEDHPDIAREIVERGHAIANHSYDHMDWRQPGAREDAIRTQDIIRTATGVTPSCARPPFGADDENLLSILDSLGMKSWRWDLSAEDHTVARYHVDDTLDTIDDAINIWGAEGKIFLQHDSDLAVSPSIDGLERWLAENADRYEFKVIDGCLDYQ